MTNVLQIMFVLTEEFIIFFSDTVQMAQQEILDCEGFGAADEDLDR